MANSGAGAPLSRREPGAARPGPGQSVKPVLSESVLNRMKAAIDAEHAQAEQGRQDDPNTEPLPRVTVTGSPSRRGANRAPSPSGAGPEDEGPPVRAVKPERRAKPRAAEPPRAEEPLRVAKALRAVEPDWPLGVEPVPQAPAQPAAPVKLAPVAESAPAVELPPAVELVPAPELAPAAESAPAAELAPPPELAPAAPSAAAAPPAPAEWARPAPPVRATERDASWSPTAITSTTEPTPGSIGWLWPDEAGGGGAGGRWKPPSPWRYRAVGLAAAGVIVLGGAGVFIGMSLHHSTPVAGGAAGPAKSNPKAVAPSAATTTPAPTVPATPNPVGAGLAAGSANAASWIAQQVAVGTDVACDAQMCAALTSAGFPAAQEIQLGPNSQPPSNSSLVVMTPQLRIFLRSVRPSLGRVVAPAALASFGGVSIHGIYQAGPAAYENALSQDVQARIQVGDHLLHGGRLSASPSAGTELAAGEVDSRVLLALEALAAKEPIDVLGFSDSGPEASPGVPFRIVDLAITEPGAGTRAPGYLQTLRETLQAHANFPVYTHVGPTKMPDGQTAVQIEYAAPSPLGLLTP
jgi:hypothetical protein